MKMAVAKSYENFTIVGEPYAYDNNPKKLFVRAKGPCPRCGGSGHYSYNQMDGTRCYGCMGSGVIVKEIRWYTDSERATMDRAAEKRAAAAAEKREARRIQFSDKNKYGFGTEGYITVYKGDSQTISDFFKSFTIDEEGHKAAWYNNIFGWFTPSKITFERELPEGVEAIRISWDEVKDEEDAEGLRMKNESIVKSYINSLITEPSRSEYQGEKGDWIEKEVTIKRVIELDGRYGLSYMHIMEDAKQNVFTWTTSSTCKEVGETLHLRMKVKDHNEYKGTKQTIVYYCKEI